MTLTNFLNYLFVLIFIFICPNRSPLVCFSCRGNHDLKYVDNSYGAPEYSCKYVSKADQPDSRVLQNIISKKLASYSLYNASTQPDMQKKLSIIMNAVIAGQQIGQIHVCSFLLKQKFVDTNRKVINFNTKKFSDLKIKSILLDKELLESMESSAIVENLSPNCVIGFRKAYNELCRLIKKTLVLKGDDVLKKLTFYAFRSAYSVLKQSDNSRGAKSKIKVSEVVEFSFDKDGFIENATTFIHDGVCNLLFFLLNSISPYLPLFRMSLFHFVLIDIYFLSLFYYVLLVFFNFYLSLFLFVQIYYQAMRETPVIQLVPYYGIDVDNEQNCYSLLLQFSDWGLLGEESMLIDNGEPISAVAKLQVVSSSFPEWIQRSISRRQGSDNLLNAAGKPAQSSKNDTHSNQLNEYLEFNSLDSEGLHNMRWENVESETSTIKGKGVEIYNETQEKIKGYREFIDLCRQKKLLSFTSSNQLTDAEIEKKDNNMNEIIQFSEYDTMQQELNTLVNMLNTRQRQAYDKIKACMMCNDGTDEQLFMFLSGEGGTGKSYVIKCVKLLCRLM